MRQEHARRYTCWMVLIACLGLSLLGLAAMVAAQDTPSGDPSFIPPSAKQTQVFRSPSGMSNGIKFDAECNMVNAEGLTMADAASSGRI